MSNPVSLEPEFYPIERLLLCGPLADAAPLARTAEAAGHRVTLLVPDEEIAAEEGPFRVLQRGETVEEGDFDLAVDLYCTDLEAKAETLFYLEDALAESVPLLTLTLAISTAELVREMMIPERVVGFSLLPPFSEAKVAELMASLHTATPALHSAERFFESLGLSVKKVADSPGGVFARTVCCLVNEAALALQDRIAAEGEIDLAMTLGVNYPLGPLAWGDRIGLDRVLAVMDGLFAEFKEERYRATPLLKKLVRAGYTGEKAGRGFFPHRSV